MGSRTKLAVLALGALTVALALLMPLLVPTPKPPNPVGPIELDAPPGAERPPAARTDATTAERSPSRSRRSDRRAGARARQKRDSKTSPHARPNRRREGAGGGGPTPSGGLPATDSPAGRARGDTVQRSGRSPAPRITPVSGDQPGAGGAAPQAGQAAPLAAPAQVPSEPADPADPPDPPEPPDEPAGAVDEDAVAVAADPPDQPEPAGGEP
jgi:hypothetical protein